MAPYAVVLNSNSTAQVRFFVKWHLPGNLHFDWLYRKDSPISKVFPTIERCCVAAVLNNFKILRTKRLLFCFFFILAGRTIYQPRPSIPGSLKWFVSFFPFENSTE